MNKPPFFLSPPRTRSTLLYELAEDAAINYHGLRPIINHSELFLEFNYSNKVFNYRENVEYPTELYPIIRDGNVHIHYIYPYVHNSLEKRNNYKVKILKEARDLGLEFYFKGTMQCAECPDLVEFYKNRHWVITKRKDIVEQIISTLYAGTISIFTIRQDEAKIKAYNKATSQKVTINLSGSSREEYIKTFIPRVNKTHAIERELILKGIDYTIAYYEDLETEDAIVEKMIEIIGDKNWKPKHGFSPTVKRSIPYEDLIENYSEVRNYIEGLL